MCGGNFKLNRIVDDGFFFPVADVMNRSFGGGGPAQVVPSAARNRLLLRADDCHVAVGLCVCGGVECMCCGANFGF